MRVVSTRAGRAVNGPSQTTDEQEALADALAILNASRLEDLT